METCQKCRIEKPTPEFYKDKKRKSGLASWCKNCTKLQAKTHYHKNKTRWLERAYGITLKDKERMFTEQNKSCGICEKELQLSAAFVDHCHTTGNVRGLLCSKCNTVLGFVEDSTKTLQNAINYLYTQHRKVTP